MAEILTVADVRAMLRAQLQQQTGAGQPVPGPAEAEQTETAETPEPKQPKQPRKAKAAKE